MSRYKRLGSAAASRAGQAVKYGAAALAGMYKRSKGKKPSKRRTRTKTKKRKRNKISQSSTQHNDMAGDKRVIVLGQPKKLFQPLGKWNYRWGIRGSTAGIESEGLQYSVDMLSYMTYNWFLGATQPAGTHDPYRISNNIFDMNPYQTVTGGAVIGSVTTPNSDYVHIHDIESDYLITSFAQVACWIEINWYIAKRDSPTNPCAAWNQALTDKHLGQTAEVLDTETTAPFASAAGFPYHALVNTTLGGQGIRTHYGMSPFSEKQFGKLYKKAQSCRFVLNAGDTRKIGLKVMVNKTFSKSYFNIQGSDVNYAGRSIFANITVRPSVVLVKDAAGDTVEPTTGVAPVAWVINSKVNMSSLGASRVEYNRALAENVTTIGIPTHATVNEQIVNDIDAVISQNFVF